MAVEFEGFSIREYVSKMRNVDVVKCWPFSKGDDDQVKKKKEEVSFLDFLPPITVTKYRWWTHELELARSRHDVVQTQSVRDNSNLESEMILRNEESEKLDRDCTAATAVDEYNDVAAKKGKKAKAPKKRSIIEICAVSPPVQKVGEGELKRVKKKKSKLKQKEKLKKKISKNNVSIPNKENLLNLKQKTAVKFSGLLYSSPCNKRFSDDIVDAVSIRKKKSTLKCLSRKKQRKVVQTSKLIGKHQKPVIPVRGILKNQTKVASGKNSSRICDMQCNSDPNPCSPQRSERHVRFSGKDDILGPRRKDVSSIEGLELQSRSNSSLDAVAASSAKERCLKSNRELAVMEENGSEEDVSFGSENRFEFQPLNESDSWDDDDMPNLPRPQISCQEKLEKMSYKSIPLNQVGFNGGNFPVFDQGNPIISDKTSHDRTSRNLFPPIERSERCNSIINYHHGNVSTDSTTSAKMIDRTGCPTHGVSATSSMAYMKALAHPSSSCLAIREITDERIQSLPQTTAENYNCRAPQSQPFCHLSHKELMGSLGVLPKQKSIMFEGKSLDEDFFGLPLNSQGELIQLNSRDKVGFNQLKKAGTLTGSSSSLPMHNHVMPEGMGNCLNLNERYYVDRTLPKDYFKLLPPHTCLKENLSGHTLSRFDVTESQGSRNTDMLWPYTERSNHSLFPWESEMAMMNVSFHGCRQHDQVQNQVGTGQVKLHERPSQRLSHITQPTMRLMGQDVTVGRSSKDSQGYENGKFWTDKEIITEHRPICTVTDNSVNRHFHSDWVLHSPMEKTKEPIPHSFDVRSGPLSQILLQAETPDFRILHSHPHPSWQTNILSQNSSFAINGNPSSNLHTFARPPISPTSFNRAPNCLSETGSFKVRSQIPVPSSIPQNTYQHMHLNSAELKYKQSQPPATKSVFEFPFLRPDCREHVEPSWFQETSKALPPWLLHASQEKETLLTSSPPFSDVIAKHHSCANGADFLSGPSMNHAPMFSYPYNPITSHSHMQSSLDSASLAQPSLIPILPGYKPTSALNMGFKNKCKDRTKPFPVRNLDIPYKTRKRPAIKLDDSRRRTKIPNFRMQEDLNALTGSKARGNSSTERHNAGAFELNSNRDGASIVTCDPKETHKDSFKNSLGIDCSKLDGMMKSGPHKLSAGAKHILKPRQSIDQDNSRPTHSTIPFPATTSSVRIPEPQKSAKIYRF